MDKNERRPIREVLRTIGPPFVWIYVATPKEQGSLIPWAGFDKSQIAYRVDAARIAQVGWFEEIGAVFGLNRSHPDAATLFNLERLGEVLFAWPLANPIVISGGFCVVVANAERLEDVADWCKFGRDLGTAMLDPNLTGAQGRIVNVRFHLFLEYSSWQAAKLAYEECSKVSWVGWANVTSA